MERDLADEFAFRDHDDPVAFDRADRRAIASVPDGRTVGFDPNRSRGQRWTHDGFEDVEMCRPDVRQSGEVGRQSGIGVTRYRLYRYALARGGLMNPLRPRKASFYSVFQHRCAAIVPHLRPSTATTEWGRTGQPATSAHPER